MILGKKTGGGFRSALIRLVIVSKFSLAVLVGPLALSLVSTACSTAGQVAKNSIVSVAEALATPETAEKALATLQVVRYEIADAAAARYVSDPVKYRGVTLQAMEYDNNFRVYWGMAADLVELWKLHGGGFQQRDKLTELYTALAEETIKIKRTVNPL